MKPEAPTVRVSGANVPVKLGDGHGEENAASVEAPSGATDRDSVPRSRSVNANAWAFAGSREASGAFRPASPSPDGPGPGRNRTLAAVPGDRGLLADAARVRHGDGEECAREVRRLGVEPEGAEVRGGEGPRRLQLDRCRRPPRRARAGAAPGRGGPRPRGGPEGTPRTPSRRASSRRASRPSTPASRAREAGRRPPSSTTRWGTTRTGPRTVCGPPHACAISPTASRRRDSRSATRPRIIPRGTSRRAKTRSVTAARARSEFLMVTLYRKVHADANSRRGAARRGGSRSVPEGALTAPENRLRSRARSRRARSRR